MIEKIGPDAATGASDGEAVDSTRSPNQSSRRARPARRIDPLEPSVEAHATDHPIIPETGSPTRFLKTNQSPPRSAPLSLLGRLTHTERPMDQATEPYGQTRLFTLPEHLEVYPNHFGAPAVAASI